MTILETLTTPSDSTLGPCTTWVTEADRCSPCSGNYTLDEATLEDWELVASEILYRLSAQQFPGECSETVRPCTRHSFASSPFTKPVNISGRWELPLAACGCNLPDTCGCGNLRAIGLGRAPIVSIEEVKVDGTVLDPSLYRVDEDQYLVRLNDSDGTNPGWPCFPAGTLVLTSRGLRPIEEIQPGERVLTHRNRWRRVLRSGKTGESETVRITGRGGVITSTPDHRFWASEVTGEPGKRKLGVAEWKQAQELLGHAWAIPVAAERLLTPLPNGWRVTTKDFWWMVGRWVGDGWVAPQGNSVYVCSGHHEADVLENQLNLVGKIWKRTEQRTGTRFRLADKNLYQWLVSEFKTGAANKEIPAWLLGCEHWIREAFLDGFVSADGWKGQGKRGRPFTSVRTVSRKLAISLKLLVASLGFAPTYYEAAQTTTHIEGRKVNGQFTYRVDWPEGKPGEIYCQAWADDIHLWGRVRKVELDETVVDVYDLEVADDNSFVADGMVVHNCCQDLVLPDTADDTFSVTFTWGRNPPRSGIRAAAALACELYRACEPDTFGGECRLPPNVIQVARQGVTVLVQSAADIFIPKPGQPIRVGLHEVDAFLAAWNPNGLTAPCILLTPDIPPEARRVGTA